MLSTKIIPQVQALSLYLSIFLLFSLCWCNNKFFPYEGFKPYPYKEYSVPWFNNNYYTLKGAELELKCPQCAKYYRHNAILYHVAKSKMCHNCITPNTKNCLKMITQQVCSRTEFEVGTLQHGCRNRNIPVLVDLPGRRRGLSIFHPNFGRAIFENINSLGKANQNPCLENNQIPQVCAQASRSFKFRNSPSVTHL